MDRGGVTTFYHKDGLGSVTELSDLSHSQVGSYKYDVFGSIRSQTGSINNPYLFTSRALDTESGLYYYRARYYNSNIGRFISRDPILNRKFITSGGLSDIIDGRDILPCLLVNPQDLNAYTYVSNNPINWVDPLGLCKESCAACRARAQRRYEALMAYAMELEKLKWWGTGAATLLGSLLGKVGAFGLGGIAHQTQSDLINKLREAAKKELEQNLAKCHPPNCYE